MLYSSLALPVDRSEVEPIDRHETNTEQRLQVAIAGLLVYDTLITLDREVKHFWVKVPKRAVDYVFFLNRYVGTLGAVAFMSCNFAVWTRIITGWVTIISIDYILMIRVLALYSLDKRLSVFLGLFLVLEATSTLVVVIYGTTTEHAAVGSITKSVTVCNTDFIVPWSLGTLGLFIPIIYATILMVLALYKAAEYWRLSAGLKGFMLVNILIRDQALYFILVVACCVLNVIEFRLKFLSVSAAEVPGTLGNPALLTILGSRMLFNLKEASELGVNEGTNIRITPRTGSPIDFVEPGNPQREGTTATDANSGTVGSTDFATPDISQRADASESVANSAEP